MSEQSKLDIELGRDNLVAYLELEALKVGSQNQRERWAHGVLPDDELTRIVRDHVFHQSLMTLRRWEGGELRQMVRAIRDKCTKADARCLWSDITHETGELAEMDADEWECAKIVKDAIEVMTKHPWLQHGGKVAVDWRTNWTSCKVCKAETWRHVAKISVHWAGRVLVREYIMEPKRPSSSNQLADDRGDAS